MIDSVKRSPLRTAHALADLADRRVRHGGIVKGQRKIIIVPEDGGERR